MIDWLNVTFNALWLIGAAVSVAALSHANWMAHVRGVRTRQLLSATAFQLPFTIGLLLISLGLFFVSRGWLEHILWALLVVVFLWQVWVLWRRC